MADPNASRKTDVRIIDDRYIGFQTDYLPMRVKAWRGVYREAELERDLRERCRLRYDTEVGVEKDQGGESLRFGDSASIATISLEGRKANNENRSSARARPDVLRVGPSRGIVKVLTTYVSLLCSQLMDVKAKRCCISFGSGCWNREMMW
jgi:hypothetical protein